MSDKANFAEKLPGPAQHYDLARPYTADERYVQKQLGYPNVDTSVLKPYGTLEPHGHHSWNVHYITKGEMTAWRTKPSQKLGIFRKGDTLTVQPEVCYRALAGEEGCKFVEGHRDLSPTTAKRFEDRGLLKKCANGKMVDNRFKQMQCTDK